MLPNNKILIVGGDSNLAKNFSLFLKKKKIKFVKTTRRRKNKNFMDLTKVENFKIPINISSAVIFAYQNNIAFCEENYKKAYLINVKNIIKLIKKLLAKKIFILFISTNLVFDNSKKKRLESTKTRPITNYGKMKSICENKIIKYCEKNNLNNYYSILRISKVLSHEINPIKMWIDNIKRKNVMLIPNDIYCCPIDLNSLNQTIFKIARNFYKGIFHLSGSKEYTYYDLAKKIFGTKNNLKLFRPINSKKLSKTIYNSKIKTFLSIGRNSQKIGIKKIKLSKIKK